MSHTMLQKYPLKTLYVTRFLKAIISQVWNSNMSNSLNSYFHNLIL